MFLYRHPLGAVPVLSQAVNSRVLALAWLHESNPRTEGCCERSSGNDRMIKLPVNPCRFARTSLDLEVG